MSMNFKISNDTPANRQGYGSVPVELRGKITGTLPVCTARIGGEKTNAEFAKELDITKRQASKQRKGW